jgi:NADPH:quinone reductase-like Zn-dependent oxidoreductase
MCQHTATLLSAILFLMAMLGLVKTWLGPDLAVLNLGDLMHAVTYRTYGDPSVLSVDDVAEPHAGPGQIRIRAAAASVNPVDWKFRYGYMAEFIPLRFPAIPGNDAAGGVDELGDGVEGVSVGDQVFGTTMLGGTAQNVVLSAWAPIPASMTVEQAAGAGFAGIAAVRGLDILDLSAGQTLLIEGAAGGVGTIASQVAVARGLTVIGTAREANHDYLRSLGVIPTTYGGGLPERVAALVPNGVDGALDNAGSGSLVDLIAIAGAPNRVATLVDLSAPAVGAHLVDATSGNPSAALQEIADLAADGKLTVTIMEAFPMERIADAHELSQSGHVRGKLVITI